MTIFNRIVLSKVEPENTKDLWMRNNIPYTLKDGKKGMPHSKSLWWFSPSGWKKLFDFDTRYETKWLFESTAQAETPLEATEVHDPVIGITEVTNTVHIYDATRTLGNNKNLVNETGLKHHVDDLQGQINSLKSQVTTLQSKVSTLESYYDDLSADNNALEHAYEELKAKVESLTQST